MGIKTHDYFAVLPVKSPRNSKQRLIGFLDADKREELAWLLYKQTFATLCKALRIDLTCASQPAMPAP